MKNYSKIKRFIMLLLLTIQGCTVLPTSQQAITIQSPTGVFDLNQAAKIETEIDRNYPNLYSILIQQGGTIVYEKYYRGHTAVTYTHVFSVTKSVMSALVGIALDKGKIQSLDQPIADYLPEYFPDPDKYNKKEITIRHALTMTSGQTPTDQTLNRWMSSPDWFAYTIDQPKDFPAGQKFSYNTGLTHLLSGVITRASGMSTKDFADRYLFGPLGITNYRWETDPKGYYGGGHLLYLTPRDMAKFGQLYLQKGMWNDVQVVPQAWVDESTRSQVKVDDITSYGYLWWVYSTYDSKNKKALPAFAAHGMGNQHIIVIPERDLVVTITCDPDRLSKNRTDPAVLVEKFILPALP
ncbi:MAG: serine hydrolase [Chloroflexi bacterium]|nr:serine hydrolase [Chloroflexota bacterium]